MTNKEIYRNLQEEFAFPLTMQAWWMDAVCAGKKWDVLLSYDAQGRVRAAMPYLIRKRLFMRFIVMPQQTQIGGMWIHPDYREEQEVKLICEDFAQQLKALKLAYYYQQYSLDFAYPKLLKKSGFRVKKRITYRVNDLSDMDSVVENFSKNKKRQLQKAVTLRDDLAMHPEDFYQFHKECLRKQGKEISYTREFLLVLYQKALRHKQAQIVRIMDDYDNTLAAALLVWDKTTMYYLIPCYDPDYKDSGASARLALESMKLAQYLDKQFDFEGSMIKGVANHYQQFGATATTYYSAQKYYHPIFAILLLMNWLRNRKKW